MRWLTRFTPRASVGTHLVVAALMWSFIGFYLMVRGWLLIPGAWEWVLALALALGTLKAYWVLDKAARKNAARITSRQDGACLGGVYSWRMWGLVVCMMLAGRLLRHSALPVLFLAVLYLAVGWALFLSSRLLWRTWSSLPEKEC